LYIAVYAERLNKSAHVMRCLKAQDFFVFSVSSLI